MANINEKFSNRRARVRRALKSAANTRPRLSVHRSSAHIYAQVIDDTKGVTLAAASTLEKTAKCPEPLCPTRVLPPLGRRDPSPERTLLLRRRSYWLMRRSRWALSSFGFWPRFESPCRL